MPKNNQINPQTEGQTSEQKAKADALVQGFEGIGIGASKTKLFSPDKSKEKTKIKDTVKPKFQNSAAREAAENKLAHDLEGIGLISPKKSPKNG